MAGSKRSWWGASEPQVQESEEFNLLMVSDIHLGETAKERSRIEFLKRTDVADRELCRFLEFHRTYRPGGRPWRLVLAGDLFDFVGAPMSPDPELTQERLGFTMGSHERHGSLDNSEVKVRWKLERILDRHAAVLSHLADFVASGNRLVILSGNHDAELFWPAVREKFVERLVDTYFGSEEIEGITPDEFRARIEFSSWIYQIPQQIHIQHGQQYDPYCSQWHPLDPRRPGQEELLELAPTAILIRYGLAKVRGISAHDKDNYAFMDYMRLIWRLPFRTSGALLLAYFRQIYEQFRYWTGMRRADPGPIQERHNQALTKEAERLGMTPQNLEAINRLCARPINLGYGSIISGLFFDTIATVILAPIALLLWWLLAPFKWRGKLVGTAAIVGGVAALLAFFRSRRPDTSVSPKMREAARLIAPIVRTPFVAMGHSHHPEMIELSPETTYVNTGCWLHPEQEARIHEGECDCPMTYLELVPRPEEKRAAARLMRWCASEGRPHTIAEDEQPLS